MIVTPLHDTPPDPAWSRFSLRETGRPELTRDALYALPLRLIEILAEDMPGLLTPLDLKFEQDLAELGGGGFFLQRQFNYPLIPELKPVGTDNAAFDERQRKTDLAIREMFEEDLSAGKNSLAYDHYLEWECELTEDLNARIRGYAGWLLTHPQFHESRRDYLSCWTSKICETREIPRMPSFIGGSRRDQIANQDRDFYDLTLIFCQSWNLDTLITFDLPLPLAPALGSGPIYNVESVASAGLTFFVPHYMAVEKALKIHDLTQRHKSVHPAAAIREWIDGEKGWGYERYALMLEIYYFLELGLKTRYPTKLARQISQFDRSFARWKVEILRNSSRFESSVDSMRKIRQKMEKRLKQCQTTSSSARGNSRQKVTNAPSKKAPTKKGPPKKPTRTMTPANAAQRNHVSAPSKQKQLADRPKVRVKKKS